MNAGMYLGKYTANDKYDQKKIKEDKQITCHSHIFTKSIILMTWRQCNNSIK